MNKRNLLKKISLLMDEPTTCNSCKVEEIIDIIEDYKNGNTESICPICRAKDICDTPNCILNEEDFFYLLDVMREILMHYGILPEYNRCGCEEEIDISGCTDDSLKKAVESIIGKIYDSFMESYVLKHC